MEKVSGVNWNAMNIGPASQPKMADPFVEEQATPLWDRGPNRGHHSSVNKAIEAHRLRVEERQNRTFNRGSEVVPQQDTFSRQDDIQAVAAYEEPAGYDNYGNGDMDMMDVQMMEPAKSVAKTAVVDSFTSTEVDRPVTVGEPVPKGSYLDVEA